MKKVLKSTFLAMLLAGASFGLLACGGNENPKPQDDQSSEVEQSNPNDNTQSEGNNSESGDSVQNPDEIVKISVKASTTFDPFNAKNLEEEIKRIEIKVYTKGGDLPTIVNADKSMFSDEDWKNMTTQDGENLIRTKITYKGFVTKFSITVIKEIEVQHDGMKLEFNMNALKSQLIEGDKIPTAEEAVPFVWAWKKMENKKDEQGKFYPMEKNVAYVDPTCDRCLVLFIQVGKSPAWANKIDQTQDLTIEDGKVLIPADGPQGLNIDFKLDLTTLKSTFPADANLPEKYKMFAYLKGGVRSDYFVEVKEDGSIKGDSLTQTVQLCVMPEDKDEFSVQMKDAITKSEEFGLGTSETTKETVLFKYQEVQMKVSDMVSVLKGAMPDYDEAYIYTYGGSSKCFVSATITNGLIKALIPSGSTGAVIVFIKEGQKPSWESKSVQSEDLEIKNGALVLASKAL